MCVCLRSEVWGLRSGLPLKAANINNGARRQHYGESFSLLSISPLIWLITTCKSFPHYAPYTKGLKTDKKNVYRCICEISHPLSSENVSNKCWWCRGCRAAVLPRCEVPLQQKPHQFTHRLGKATLLPLLSLAHKSLSLWNFYGQSPCRHPSTTAAPHTLH